MISEPLGLLIDITSAVIVMFILPVMIVTSMQERTEERYVRKVTEAFTENICTMGYIDEAVYESFISQIGAAGPHRSVRILETVHKYDPVYEEDRFTGRISEYESIKGTEEILDIMFDRGSYECRYGGMLNVSVYDNGMGFVNCFGTIRGQRNQ